MDTSEILVLAAGLSLIALVLWYFFAGEGVRAAAQATATGVQRLRVLVRGGYAPGGVGGERGAAGGRAPAQATAAGVQRLRVLVRGGYAPDVIVVKRGAPVELDFYRDETNSCTEQVIFGDFQISRMLQILF